MASSPPSTCRFLSRAVPFLEEKNDAKVLCIAAHPSAPTIAVGRDDHSVVFYNVETGKTCARGRSLTVLRALHTAVLVSPELRFYFRRETE